MAEEKRKPQVVEQLDTLSKWLDLLNESISRLEAGLEPILGPSVVAPDDKGGKPDAKCKLALHIESLADQAGASHRRIKNLIDRLEI